MQQLTVKEVIQATINILNGINIPISLFDQVGNPIKISVRNLEECVKAIEAAEPAPEEPEPAEDVPEEAQAVEEDA